MAFGDTGVLDNFNRGDGAPGANWSALWGDPQFEIVSNQAYASGSWKSGYWNPGTFGPDSEVFLTNVTPSTNYIFARLTATASPTGYLLWIQADAGALYRIASGTKTQLGAGFAMSYDAGNGVGLECIGSTIKAYENAGSGWTELATRDDETYGTAGYLGFDCAAAGYWDNFGGGTVGGGTINYKDLDGAISTIVGAIANKTMRALDGVVATIVGLLGLADDRKISGFFNVFGEERITVALLQTGDNTFSAAAADWFFGAAAGGANYQALAGAISTIVGTLDRVLTLKRSLDGAISTIVGALSAHVFIVHAALAGAISTITGSVANKTSRALAGAISTITGALSSIKMYTKALAGAISTIAGDLAKKTFYPLAGAISNLAGALTRAGSLHVALAGAISTITGTLSAIKMFTKALAGAISTIAGDLAKKTLYPLAGAISTLVGDLSAHVFKVHIALDGAISTIAGTLSSIKMYTKALAGAIATITGDLAKKPLRALAGSISTIVGALSSIKMFARALSGEISAIAGDLAKKTFYPLAGAISTLVGVLARAGFLHMALSGAIAVMTGTLTAVRVVFRHLLAVGRTLHIHGPGRPRG
jgi:hypothetical protein